MRKALSIWSVCLLVGITSPAFAQVGHATDTLVAGGTNERKKSQALSSRSVKRMVAAQEAIEMEDFVAADLVLGELLAMEEKLPSYDRSVLHNMYAYVRQSEENFPAAIEHYKKVVAEPGATAAFYKTSIQAIAQLEFIAERYEAGLEYLLAWLKISELNMEEENPTMIALAGQAYFQLDDFETCLDYTNRAIAIGEARSETGVAKENWYVLAYASYSNIPSALDSIRLLEFLVQHFPKKLYWSQLASWYGEVDRQQDQLGTLEAAWTGDYFNREAEFVALAQLQSLRGAPYKAALTLEDGLEKGTVDDEKPRNLRLLADVYRQSREFHKARDVLAKLVAVQDTREIHYLIGLTEYYLHDYAAAGAAMEEAVTRKEGKLRNPETVLLTAAQAWIEAQEWDRARDLLKTVDRKSKHFKRARQLVAYVDAEENRVNEIRRVLGDDAARYN